MPNRFAAKKKPLVSNAYKQRLGYDVLLDAGTPHELSEYFRYAAVFVPGDFKLQPNAKDPVIVARAETDMLLLVTHDSEMDEYVHRHQAGKKMHKCLSGLVRLPSGITKQRARLRVVVKGEKKLNYGGHRLVLVRCLAIQPFRRSRLRQLAGRDPLVQMRGRGVRKTFGCRARADQKPTQ